MEKISSVTTKIKLKIYNVTSNHKMVQQYGIKRIPAIALIGQKDFGIRYYGAPADWELLNFLDDIIDVSHTGSGFSKLIGKHLKKIKWPINLQLFTSSSSPYPRHALKSAIYAAIENDFINVDIIDTTEFFDLVKKYHVNSIPFTMVNEDYSYYGVLDAGDFVVQLLKSKPSKNILNKWENIDETVNFTNKCHKVL